MEESKDVRYKDTAYVRVSVPDRERLTKLIVRAKGESRTMGSFAIDCGTSPSTLSRIVNGKGTGYIQTSVLEGVAAHADPESGVTLDQLLAANGMKRKQAPPLSKPRTDTMSWSVSCRREARKIIQNELLLKGVRVQVAKSTRVLETEGDEKPYGLVQRLDVLYVTDAFKVDGVEYWGLTVNTRVTNYTDEDHPFSPSPQAALNTVAPLFLADTWLPDTMQRLKVTIVFVDENYFNGFLHLLEGKQFNNHYSVMLLDLVEHKIVREVELKRYDGKACLGIRDLPDIAEEQDGSWEYDDN